MDGGVKSLGVGVKSQGRREVPGSWSKVVWDLGDERRLQSLVYGDEVIKSLGRGVKYVDPGEF